jgi:hypothetical protein
MNHGRLLGAIWAVLAITAAPAEAQVALAAREAAEVLAVTVGRFVGKASTSEAAEQMARIGGREGLEIIASRTLQEGGEQALRQLVTNAAQYGPDYLMVLKKARSPRFMAKVLDDLPPDAVEPAIRALGRKSGGEALELTVEKYGAKALRAEVKCEGVGARLVETLGDDGLEAVNTLSRSEAITLGQYADDIARLPEAQKAGVLQLLRDDGKQMVAFMGRFIEKNPQTVLFTSAATAVILANSERLLGGDEIALDADGNPFVVSKPGAVGRIGGALMPPIYWVMSAISAAAMAWLGLRLFFLYKHENARFQSQWGHADGKESGRVGKSKPKAKDNGTDLPPEGWPGR